MANLSNLNVNIGANLAGLRSGLKSASKQITSFSEGVESKLGSVSVGNLDTKIRNIGSSSLKAVPSANKLASSMKGLQRPAKGSTMAVINFNRVIQDAPFGILGVANNLEPLITSFQNLGDESTTTGQKLSLLLKKSFTGPGALITAVSVASSLMIVFSQRMRGSGGAADEASEKIQGYVDAAENLNEILSQDTGYADEIQREIDRNKQAISLAEERARIEDRILNIKEGAVGQNAVLSDSQREQIDNLRNEIEASNQLINTLGFEKTALEDLEQSLTVLTRKQELYNGVVGTSDTKTAAFVDTITGQAQKAINNFEAGVEGSADQVRNSRQEITSLINSFQQLASNGQTNLVPLIQLLQKSLKDLTSTVKDTGEESVKAVDPIAEGFTGAWQEVEKTDKAVKKLGVSLSNMPKMEDRFPDEEFAEGSIGALEQKLQMFRGALKRLPADSVAFEAVQQRIQQTEDELDGLNTTSKKTGELGAFVGQQLGQAFAQAAIFADRLDKTLVNIGKQLASRAIVNFISLATSGGLGSLFGGGIGGFFKGLLKFHSGGTVPGPIGKERLVLAKGGETIRTPSQESTFGGRNTIHITGEFRQRGDELVAVIDQTKSGTLR